MRETKDRSDIEVLIADARHGADTFNGIGLGWVPVILRRLANALKARQAVVEAARIAVVHHGRQMAFVE